MSRRLSDDEITAVLRGATSEDREVATLAAAVGGVRTAFELRPEPSAQLEAFFEGRLSLDPEAQAGWIGEVAQPSVERQRARHLLVRWVAALGLTAQLGLGSAVAVAATAGAGAGGWLPDPAQRVFDQVVAALTPAGPMATPSERAPLVEPPRPVVITDGIDDRLARDDTIVEQDDTERDDDDSDGKRADRRSGSSADKDSDAERHSEARDAEENAADDARDAREEAEDRERDAKDDARDAQEDRADRDEDRDDDAADAEEDLSDQAADEAEDAEGDD